MEETRRIGQMVRKALSRDIYVSNPLPNLPPEHLLLLRSYP